MLVAERSDFSLWKKVQEWFWRWIFFSYERFFFGHCHVMFFYMVNIRCNFLIRRFFLFFGHCHVIFLFFDRVVRKIVTVGFSNSFVQKTIQQPAASCNVTSDTRCFLKFCYKLSFSFCIHLWKVHCEWRILYHPPGWQDVLRSHL